MFKCLVVPYNSSMARNEAHRLAQRDWYERVVKTRRQEWLKANSPCKVCGSWDNLEVDHIDPATKVHHSVWSWSAKRRIAELAKCQTLCEKCHLQKSIAYFKQINPSAKRRKVGPEGTVWCSRCEKFLPTDCFTKHKENWDGCDDHCKDCRSKRRSPHLWNGDVRITAQ